MKLIRIAHVAVSAVVLALVPVTGVSANPAPSGASPKPATPAQACGFVGTTLAQFQIGEGFSYAECLRTLAPGRSKQDPFLAAAGAQCAEYERGIVDEGFEFKLTYPYAFYADAPEGEGFPGLVARDRADCVRALYAFHTIVTYFPSGPE